MVNEYNGNLFHGFRGIIVIFHGLRSTIIEICLMG